MKVAAEHTISWYRRSLAAYFFLFHTALAAAVAGAVRFFDRVLTSGADFAILVVILGMASIWTWVYHRWLIPPMKEMVRGLTAVTDEIDVSTRVGYRSFHELGRISHGINRMIKGFYGILLKVRDHSRDISAGIAEMVELSSQSADWSHKISVAMDQFVAALSKQTELARLSGKTAQETAAAARVADGRASESARAAERARRELDKGLRAVAEIRRQIPQTVTAVHDTAAAVEQLGQLSKRVEEIAGWIGHIASQTHLLALNAGIEAARAGEAGRGFAVVAQEVQKLAAETQGAVQQIGGLIDNIREQVEISVARTRRSQSLVDEQEALIHTVATAFDDIADSTADVDRSLTAVAEAYRVMAQGNDTVIHAVDDVVQNAEHLSAAIHEVYSAVQQQTATATAIAAEARRAQERARHLEYEAIRWKGLGG